MTRQNREGTGSKLQFDQKGWPRMQDRSVLQTEPVTLVDVYTRDTVCCTAAHTKKRNIPCHQVPHTSEVYQQSVRRTKQVNDEDGIYNKYSRG